MPNIVDTSIKCPNCGAQLDAPARGQAIVCKFCQHRLSVAEPEPPPPSPSPSILASPSPPPRRAPVAGLVSVLMTLAIGAIVARSLWHAGVIPSTVSNLVSQATHGRLLWDDVGGPPVLVALPAGEAMIGRVRGDGDQLSVIAVDGKTGKLLWRSRPLGTYGEAYRDTHFAVAGSRVVISEVHSRLLILAADTGVLKREVPLTDRVRQLCGDGDAHVFAATVDGKQLSVDVATGAATAGHKPRGCAADSFDHPAPSVRAPRVDGIQTRASFSDGKTGVLVGVKHPGTAVPTAAGFDPASLAVRWRATLPSVDAVSVRDDSRGQLSALAGGRLLAIYGVGDKGWRMVALDAENGARQWESELPRIFAVDQVSSLAATASRVYVVHMSSLELYDATTGKRVAVVGDETYEN